MSARLRAAWAGARSWWEHHIGPLPRCLRTSECYRVPRWRLRVSDRLYHWRWVAIATVLNRWAPAELRHAALLLGYDAALGYGNVNVFLSHLREFTVGEELAEPVRAPQWSDLDPARAAEMFHLERSLYGYRPEWVSR